MIEPKKTIYVNNLNEKVSINKLKKELNKTFTPYGKILQITAFKTLKLKGQAFITFDNIESAINSLELNNIEIFNKPIKITFANSNSDIVESDEIIRERKQNKSLKTSKKRKLEDNGNKDNSKLKTKTKKKLDMLNEWKELPPNHILLLQNINKFDELEEFFNDFNGFENIRVVKVKNLAFIEFENEEMATNCLEQVKDDQLIKFGPEDEVLLSFAKK
ncbi:U1 small nuclear ribonucleoprotein A [Candida tropicalis]